MRAHLRPFLASASRFPRCRLFHAGSRWQTGPLDPLLPEKSPKEDDQFSEMLDDRTNALFRSLGVNANDFQKPTVSPPGKVPVPPPKPPVSFYMDTQDVYDELRAAGLTAGQSEVLMRVIQELINELVQACKQRAVPTSAAANEAYLFDAASSELRNEISTSRDGEATSYRSGIARLQRDVEILEHIATEMTNLLKADMDFEVHERKNSARGEESMIQLKIQDLHNKISTRLNSELKSEIENLRWQITRRSLAAIVVVAALFIWNTQTTSSKKTAKTEERQRNTSGTPVPVPVLAPSMSSADELAYDSAPPVEDLNELMRAKGEADHK